MRLAYTAGGIVLAAGDGTRRQIPAGVCRIERYSAAPDVCSVHWSERGIDYSAQLSAEDLRAYVLGCIVQYA
jgi:hypothetical protein